MPHRKPERIEVRVTRDQKLLIERAARLRGTSLTDFVIASMQQAATATIHDYQTLALHDEASEVFAKALLNPPSPNMKALKAAQRYKERIGS